MSMMQMLLGATGATTSYPDYLTNTDNLVFYIDFHNSDCYEDGDGANITDLTGNYSPTIVGTEDTHWSYGTSDTIGGNTYHSNNPYFETTLNGDGYINCNPDGGGDIVEYGTNDFTWEVWIKPDNTSHHTMYIADTSNDQHHSDHVSSGDDAWLQMRLYGQGSYSNQRGHFQYRFDIGTTQSVTATEDTFHGYSSSNNWGDWNYYVLTRSDSSGTYSTWKQYLNGTLLSTSTRPSSGNGPDFAGSSNDRILQIMKDSGDRGRIGMFRVYNGTALSDDDVEDHWDGEKASYGRS